MNKVYGECKVYTFFQILPIRINKKLKHGNQNYLKKDKEGKIKFKIIIINRYLWTDAFGVCNYLTLYCET